MFFCCLRIDNLVMEIRPV